MKRIIGFILDLLFFVSFLAVLLMLASYILYKQDNDISIINVLLQSHLLYTLLAGYVLLFIAYLSYYWILSTLLKQTLGQRLSGTIFTSEKKIGLWRVFLKNIIGNFWDIVLFPYTLFAAITKRPLISARLSGITVKKADHKSSAGVMFVTLVFALFIMATVGVGTYVYRTGITQLMERYTDYEKQTQNLIEKFAYQDAALVLEKYKQYNGEDNNYVYYHCIIEGNLSTEIWALDLCTLAMEKNASNTDRIKVLLSEQAKLYAANDQYVDAEKIYARLWNEFQDRSLNMKNYVAVLSELGKSKEAADVLAEIAKLIPSNDTLGLRDLGNLYERITQPDLALAKYSQALSTIADDKANQSLAGELHYYIGVLQYNKTKYSDAQTSFEQAKTLNKDFADSSDSYIILISKLKNSITK